MNVIPDYKWIIRNRALSWLRGWTESDGYKFAQPRNRTKRAACHYDHNEDFLNDIILKKGETFLDIGANVGAWTVRAASFYHHVIAVEPLFHRLLRKSLRLNNIHNVIILPYALGGNHVKPGITMADKPKLVRQVALDDLNIHPSVIKIDAEGDGYNVVAEGYSTIKKCRPTIVLEVHTEQERRVDELLQDYIWETRNREMPLTDHIYREYGKQVFLVGVP